MPLTTLRKQLSASALPTNGADQQTQLIQLLGGSAETTSMKNEKQKIKFLGYVPIFRIPPPVLYGGYGLSAFVARRPSMISLQDAYAGLDDESLYEEALEGSMMSIDLDNVGENTPLVAQPDETTNPPVVAPETPTSRV